jgi:hypothetical protein
LPQSSEGNAREFSSFTPLETRRAVDFLTRTLSVFFRYVRRKLEFLLTCTSGVRK